MILALILNFQFLPEIAINNLSNKTPNKTPRLTKSLQMVNALPLNELNLSQNFVVSFSFMSESNKTLEVKYCNGVLLSADIVLTAAHCVQNQSKLLFRFYDKNGAEILYQTALAKKIVIHPNYQTAPELTNDIALVLLNFPQDKLTEFPKIMDSNIFNLNSNLDFIAIGNGANSGIKSKNWSPSSSLKYKNLTAEYYDPQIPRFNVLQPEGGVCYGDSGGPAFVSNSSDSYLIGIASSLARLKSQNSKKKDICKMRANYTNLSYYKKWIEASIANLKITDTENFK